MSRRILHLQPDRLLACTPERGAWPVGEVFAADQAAAFAEHLRRHGDDDFLLLVDLPGEEWLSETLPALRGSDRRQLVARRLARLFPPPQLALTARRSRQDGNETLLFASLGDEIGRQPWLGALDAAGSALGGIWSIAQLAAPLLARLQPQARQGLLFSHHAPGWRASWVADGQVVFSRRCSAPSADPGPTLAAEATQIAHYLRGRRELADDAPLPVSVLLAAADRDCDLAALAPWAAKLHPLAEAARRCGLKARPADADALFRQLLARHPPPAQFASPGQRLGYRLAGLRRWLGGLALAALAGSACYALAAAQLAELGDPGPPPPASAQPAPVAPPSAATLARIATYRALQARRGDPGELWRRLGQTLLDFPEIRLDELDWQATDGEGARLDWRGEFAAAPASQIGQRFAALQAALRAAGLSVDVRQAPLAAPGEAAWRGGDEAPPPERRLSISLRRAP